MGSPCVVWCGSTRCLEAHTIVADMLQFCELGRFDAVELHAGHGYLLSQFLTPFCNRRRGRFGGPTAQDRLSYPLAVLEAVRRAVGRDVPVIVKMNATDGLPAPGWGLTVSDAITIAQGFERGGVDALVLSGGTVSRSGFAMLTGDVPRFSMARAMPGRLSAIGLLVFGWVYVPTVPFEEAFFRGQARAILSAVGSVPVALIGGVTTEVTINSALDGGFAFVQMARALIRQPDFVRRIELAASAAPSGPMTAVASPCIHCNQCVVATLDPTRPVECPERRAPASW